MRINANGIVKDLQVFSLHPEQVNSFIVLLSDEISITDLEMIYRQMQEISKEALTPEQIKILEN